MWVRGEPGRKPEWRQHLRALRAQVGGRTRHVRSWALVAVPLAIWSRLAPSAFSPCAPDRPPHNEARGDPPHPHTHTRRPPLSKPFFRLFSLLHIFSKPLQVRHPLLHSSTY